MMKKQELIKKYQNVVAEILRNEINTGIEESGKYEIKRVKQGQETGLDNYWDLKLADEEQAIIKILCDKGNWVDELPDEQTDEIFKKVMAIIPKVINEYRQMKIYDSKGIDLCGYATEILALSK